MGVCYGFINVNHGNVMGEISGFLAFPVAAYILITIKQDCKREKKLINAIECYVANNNWHYWRYLSVDRYGAQIMNMGTKKIVEFCYDFDNKDFKEYENW